MKRIFNIIILLSILALNSCADWFQGKIDMDLENENGTLKDLFLVQQKTISLSTPSQIFASEAMYSDRILLSWKSVTNATSYKIQRAVISPDADGNYISAKTYAEWEDLNWKTIIEKCYETTYNDIILSNPGTSNEEYSLKYYYRILAQNLDSGKIIESNFTNPFEKNTFNNDTYAEGYLFSPVTNVNASKGKTTDYIKLTWNNVDSATAYKIYRDSREDFTTSILITTVRGNVTEYINPISSSDQGTEFYYKVIAQNRYGNNSAYSSIAMGYALQNGAPATPTNVKVIDGLGMSKSEINISWDKIDSTSIQKIKYSLYRTSSVDSVYTLLKKDLPSETTSWKDTRNLKTGIYYYYYVLATGYELNADGEETGLIKKSSFSESGIESSAPAIGFLLSPPSAIECNDSESSENIELEWSPAIGSNLSELNKNLTNVKFTYNIYYADTENSPYSLLEGNSQIEGNIVSNNTINKTVQKKNFYKITTINTDGIESDFSIAAAPQPDAPTNVIASKTANLSEKYPDFWKPNMNEVYPVLVSWSKPSTLPEPAGYYVYRSTKPDSGFRKISEDIITDTFYLDTNDNAKAGLIYYYRIVSLNSLGQGKKGNNPETDTLYEENGSLRTSWGYGAITCTQWFREYNKDIATSQGKLTLMHKSKDTDKMGSETTSAYIPVNGNIGTLSYNAGMDAKVKMHYTEYADHYINNDSTLGIYYILNGNTDTNITNITSKNGSMANTVHCYHYKPYNGLFQGMYPGYAIYDNIEIKGGAAGGGYYLVQTYELDHTSENSGTIIQKESKVDWTIGEEIRN